jgi:uncharacterized membrane protein YbhN (UPF0104 family)
MIRKYAGPLFSLILFSAALWVLYHEAQTVHLHHILSEISAIPRTHLWLAAILTALSYFIMTGYDYLAIRFVKRSLSIGRIALASFIGYAFSNNIGFSMLAGASVRYRLGGSPLSRSPKWWHSAPSRFGSGFSPWGEWCLSWSRWQFQLPCIFPSLPFNPSGLCSFAYWRRISL